MGLGVYRQRKDSEAAPAIPDEFIKVARSNKVPAAEFDGPKITGQNLPTDRF